MPDVSDSPNQQRQEEVAKIKEWLRMESHLPNNMDELLLLRFLHSCYYNLENTKRCLERFFTMRAQTPEFFRNRDPLSKEIQQQLDITIFTGTKCEKTKKSFAFWQLNDPNLEKYLFYDCYKAFFMQMDVWLLEERFLQEEDVVIIDFKGIPFKIITAVNVSGLRKSFIYLLEAFPTRLTQVHIINCPPFIDVLYGFVKPVLPREIRNLIRFHQPKSETLFEFVPRELVPHEFGGTGATGADGMQEWITFMKKNREFYLDDARWISDEKQRKKKQHAKEASVTLGSFRSLCLD